MKKINFGLALPYISARAASRLAQLAEEAGWDGVFMGDAVWCEDPLIALAAAAMVTRHIRLGSMVIPMPLRKPWKVASEALALDRLSDGRFILGLGAGAVWMGWQAFPAEITDARQRSEMLDESIDILTLMFQGKGFDYPGKHFLVKLTALDEMHYPPRPIQQPRIPIWVPGLWPRQKSMRRALKADGVLVEKVSPEGKTEAVTPEDVREIRALAHAQRVADANYDIVVSGQTGSLEPGERKEKIATWEEAGATWWVEAMWGFSEAQAEERIRQGPPWLGGP